MEFNANSASTPTWQPAQVRQASPTREGEEAKSEKKAPPPPPPRAKPPSTETAQNTNRLVDPMLHSQEPKVPASPVKKGDPSKRGAVKLTSEQKDGLETEIGRVNIKASLVIKLGNPPLPSPGRAGGAPPSSPKADNAPEIEIRKPPTAVSISEPSKMEGKVKGGTLANLKAKVLSSGGKHVDKGVPSFIEKQVNSSSSVASKEKISKDGKTIKKSVNAFADKLNKPPSSETRTMLLTTSSEIINIGVSDTKSIGGLEDFFRQTHVVRVVSDDGVVFDGRAAKADAIQAGVDGAKVQSDGFKASIRALASTGSPLLQHFVEQELGEFGYRLIKQGDAAALGLKLFGMASKGNQEAKQLLSLMGTYRQAIWGGVARGIVQGDSSRTFTKNVPMDVTIHRDGTKDISYNLGWNTRAQGTTETGAPTEIVFGQISVDGEMKFDADGTCVDYKYRASTTFDESKLNDAAKMAKTDPVRNKELLP